MNLSRRSFLGGSLSLGAFAGCRAFRAPAGLFAADDARLRLGVVSDIHIDCGRGDFRKFGDASQFEKTLKWFDEQGVDGVIVAGDMADNGMINQLECVGEAWFRIFPKGCSLRDGRPVEQLFIYGNHDLEGQGYDKFSVRYQFEPKSFAAGQIRHDPALAWEQVFHEPYAPIWFKEVKGYQFVGAHWSLGERVRAWDGIPEVEPWFRENAARIDRTKPFFFIQHPHPQGTVYGSDAWGADKGYATRALSAFPNAVAFSGHSHFSLTDDRSVWQGAFTSVATSSLRYGGRVNKWNQRQGMLMTVYDDRIILARRDFLHDESLGEDWVIPLNGDVKLFDFSVRKATVRPPEFQADAKLSLRCEKEGWLIAIPCASAGPARAFRYEIALEGAQTKGVPVVFHAWDATYNMPPSRAGVETKYLVKKEAIAKVLKDVPSEPHFVVTPLDAYGNRGSSLKV